MQIILIGKSRSPNLVWLKFDNNSLLPLKIDDIVVLGLKKFVPLSDDEYTQIQHKSAEFLLFEYALRQIAISPKTKKILHQKLLNYCQRINQKFNYPLDLLNQLTATTLDNIVSRGLIDDSAFIDSYVRRHPKMSQVQIKYTLQNLGVVVPSSFQNQTSDVDKVKQILIKKYKNANMTDFKTKNKIIASLYRKGFALGDIKTAIDDWHS